MKLYKDAGVNPLGGCLPLLLQFPFLIAMYAVIRMPMLRGCSEPSRATRAAYVVMNNHLPVDSQLFNDVITHQNTGVFIVNLQCSAAQSGTQAVIDDTTRAHPGHPVVPGKPLLNGRTMVNGDPKTGSGDPGAYLLEHDRLRERGGVEDPLLRHAAVHGRHDLLSAAPDAGRESAGFGRRPTAGHHAASCRSCSGCSATCSLPGSCCIGPWPTCSRSSSSTCSCGPGTSARRPWSVRWPSSVPRMRRDSRRRRDSWRG